jgi:tight adherence protein C
MTHDQLLVLFIIGCGVLVLLTATLLLLFFGASDKEIAHRIASLRQGGGATTRYRSSDFWSALISLTHRLGTTLRARMLSDKAAESLAKTLAASGFEPSKAMPLFVGAKIVCLFTVPVLVYLVTALLGYSAGKQTLIVAISLVLAMLLPNWVVTLIRRPFQSALRRGIPDALDLMVVCAEAGLGLESAVERVANEMMKSNRPVGVEFSLLMHDMRVLPDRRMALTNLAERTGLPALKRLAGTIAQTLKYGTPLGQGLRALAAEMRDERMIQFEERAGKLPALLVMPMILFILPVLFIIVMGQPVSEIMRVLANTH